jgi:hypothetical protein
MTPNPTFGNFNAASLTNNSTVTYSLVLTAMTLPILRWAKDLLTKKPVHLRLKGAVIDRLWLSDFTNYLPIRERALPPLHNPIW